MAANTGGTYTHKNPNCQCNPCKSRRRQAEAVLGATGAGGSGVEAKTPPPTTLSQINADFPLIATDGKTPKERIIQWLNLKNSEPGITNTEIARRIGIHRGHLQALLARATAEGWLRFDDPLSRLEHEIIPKAMDNLSVLLKNQDKTATLETMKGTAFPAYRESKGISDAPQTVLALKIEAIPSDPDTKVLSGTIVGKPRELKE